SHKVARLIVPWALIALFACTLGLAPGRPAIAVVLAAQGVFYGLAIAEALFHQGKRYARISFTFVMLNISAIAGLAALRRVRAVWRWPRSASSCRPTTSKRSWGLRYAPRSRRPRETWRLSSWMTGPRTARRRLWRTSRGRTLASGSCSNGIAALRAPAIRRLR